MCMRSINSISLVCFELSCTGIFASPTIAALCVCTLCSILMVFSCAKPVASKRAQFGPLLLLLVPIKLPLIRVVFSFTWYDVNFSPQFTLHLLITSSNSLLNGAEPNLFAHCFKYLKSDPLKPFKWNIIFSQLFFLFGLCDLIVVHDKEQKRGGRDKQRRWINNESIYKKTTCLTQLEKKT